MKISILCVTLFSLQLLSAQDSLVNKLGNDLIALPSSVGLSIGLYTNGRDHYYDFGLVEKDKVMIPSKQTLYEIGSIAKTFTSYLLAKAILDKKINADDDIRNYLDGDYPNLQYEGQPIRIIHLANATSCIPDWLPETPDIIKKADPDSASFLRERIYGQYSREDFYNALHEVVLDTLPGTKRRHSNAGADLLTYILEKVYSMSQPQMVEQYILQSFGMKHTVCGSGNSNKQDYRAKGYNGKGTEMPYLKNGYWSTTSDLLQYMKALMKKQNDVAKLVLTKTINVDLSTSKVVSRDKDVYSVAMSWYSYKYDKGYSQTWYDGGTHGFSSYVVFYPELETVVVLLTNVANEVIPGKLRGIAYEIAEKINRRH